ncbi:hypothetical protein ATCC90586_010918 [Pythium insidiosum]|nr:hypothetical protein ATCC90586_010918 [Pythium insidiosum]
MSRVLMRLNQHNRALLQKLPVTAMMYDSTMVETSHVAYGVVGIEGLSHHASYRGPRGKPKTMTRWPEYGERRPLWEAVYRQDNVAVHKLLSAPSASQQVNEPHGTAVHLAVSKGNQKMLKALLFTSGDPNARMINGTTPLHIAVQLERRDLVQDLLLMGADPMLRNFTDQTAIDMATARQLTNITTLLVQAAHSLPVQRELKRQQQALEKPSKQTT